MRLWGYKVIPQGRWSYMEYRVITWGYTSGVIKVIDMELSELWGYKVIPQGRWSYNPITPITPHQ